MPRIAKKSSFVVFLGPADASIDLEPMKLYRLATPEANDPQGYLRVIDESGEDYLYPARFFAAIAVPKEVVTALAAAS